MATEEPMATKEPMATEYSEESVVAPSEKAGVVTNEHLNVIRTISRVPGNDNYYEKDGLRTYGDGEDHDHEPSVSQCP